MWEGVGDRTEMQHTDPHSIGHNCVSFAFSWAAQLGAWMPSLSGCWFSLLHLISNLSDSQLIWSPTTTTQSGAWGLPLLVAFSTATCLQLVCSPTDWISCALSYIIVQRSPSSCWRHNFTLIQPIHGQVYNPDIPRPDAPVIYTGAFPILTARLGRRSIYNNYFCWIVVLETL